MAHTTDMGSSSFFSSLIATKPACACHCTSWLPTSLTISSDVAQRGRVVMHSLSWPLQRSFDIINPMVGGVAVEVERPFGSVLTTAEPFLRRITQSAQQILLNLPVPG